MCHRSDVPKTDGEMGDRFSINSDACRPFGTSAVFSWCLMGWHPASMGWHLASMGWHPWLLHVVPLGLVRVFAYRGTRVGPGSMGCHPWLSHGVPSGLVAKPRHATAPDASPGFVTRPIVAVVPKGR
jgi:hypothetical protein